MDLSDSIVFVVIISIVLIDFLHSFNPLEAAKTLRKRSNK